MHDPEETLRSFETRVAAQTQRALALSAQLEATEVTVRSAGGEVTVRVNSAGGLTDLKFHREADGLPRAELARLVLATSRQAQAQLADRIGDLVSGVYGSDSSTAAFVTDAYASKYAAPDDADNPEEGRT